MGDWMRRTGVFVQDVREVLRKRDDERAKCPRCRGSGLLHLHYSAWQRFDSNSQCLFCEGVGVMPIVGLRGYMIGRTDAMLSTNQQIKRLPFSSQDYTKAHNSGHNSTKVSTRRRFKIPSQFLYNPLSNPCWLLEAQREASLVEFNQKEATDHSSNDTSPVRLFGLDQAGWRYKHRFYARTSSSFSSPTSTSQADSRVKEGVAADDGSLQGSGSREASEAVVDLDFLSHAQNFVQDSNKHVKSSTRGTDLLEGRGTEFERKQRKKQKLELGGFRIQCRRRMNHGRHYY